MYNSNLYQLQSYSLRSAIIKIEHYLQTRKKSLLIQVSWLLNNLVKV